MLPAMSEWDLEIETRCRSHWHPEERMCWCPVDKAWMSHVCGTQGSGDEIKQCLSTRPQIRGLCRAQLRASVDPEPFELSGAKAMRPQTGRARQRQSRPPLGPGSKAKSWKCQALSSTHRKSSVTAASATETHSPIHFSRPHFPTHHPRLQSLDGSRQLVVHPAAKSLLPQLMFWVPSVFQTLTRPQSPTLRRGHCPGCRG